MNNQIHNAIVSFIWGIADDCLRDVYVRGKYRDVILPYQHQDHGAEGVLRSFCNEIIFRQWIGYTLRDFGSPPYLRPDLETGQMEFIYRTDAVETGQE